MFTYSVYIVQWETSMSQSKLPKLLTNQYTPNKRQAREWCQAIHQSLFCQSC